MLFRLAALVGVLLSSSSSRPPIVLEAPRWTKSGLLDAVVVAMATDPHKPARLYAAGPGIFRSEDYGASWQTLSEELKPDRFTVDPSQADRIYALVGGVVWRSSDAGETWAPTSGQLQQVTLLVADGSGALYASGAGGILKSSDTGDHWSAANSGLDFTTRRVGALAADPKTSGRLYVSLFQFDSLVFRSTDGAVSWQGPILTTAFLEGVLQFDFGPGLTRTAYAARSFHEMAISSGSVFASRDADSTWTSIFSSQDVRCIAADPVRPDTVYVSVPPYGLNPTGIVGVYRVTPLGPPSIIGERGAYAVSLAVAPDGSTLYAISVTQELSTLRLDGPSRYPKTLSTR